ncbi:hypothetical protein Dred_0801 [Desulforamulus reducens MI-1]|uniref:CobQ/CobB/MinD/ParA nucleotide binding domain-containing protein n=1 Tax=Desulforamulus reducens (strain ATCC BAA-1160 / DSM 100696 / MI-1) TaxID=349161 RepID=A4J2N6_DESRM|nr:cellulose synthase operon protein YhjQ/BcsQ [Desulforamulus reducens]ABO49339.1 hypothetical protein Dred_0801 [Desulforamulus reducens MI-1]
MTVIVRKCNQGGVDDPILHISDVFRTLVVAGPRNNQGMAYHNRVTSLGVASDNVIFLEKGTNWAQMVADRVIAMIAAKPVVQNEDDYWGFDSDPQPPVIKPKKIKVISILGYRGGTGRSTIAASLALHYVTAGERVTLIDLGSPPSLHRHTGAVMEMQDGVLFGSACCDVYSPASPAWAFSPEQLGAMIEDFRKNRYRRIIVDFSAQPAPGLLETVQSDRIITVVDSDIEQSVEPAMEQKNNSIFVYNKAIPETDVDLIQEYTGDSLIVIPRDVVGIQAALTAKEPAYNKSEAVATGIGALAAEIEK